VSAAPAAARQALPPSAPEARRPAPSERALAIEEPSVVDFACADGSRLRVTYSPDRSSAVAQWNDGAGVALQRADRDGLIRYASLDGEFLRAGRRVAWAGAADIEVRPGDTLWKISERTYGTRDRANEIARLNADRIPNPDLIYPGQRLRLAGEAHRICTRPLAPRAT
jgi:nucleoid-associated protein YgaU